MKTTLTLFIACLFTVTAFAQDTTKYPKQQNTDQNQYNNPPGQNMKTGQQMNKDNKQYDQDQNQKQNEKGKAAKYCASFNNGQASVTKDNNPLQADVKLKNGSTLTKDGKIIKKDGTTTTLKSGECIDENGNMPSKVTSKK
jgi:hypothetical protein